MSVLDAFSLSGKVSVVTGANRGIARALVTALAEEARRRAARQRYRRSR
jgi:NAD(P)-dependent dehydrogenase (short-subunit alcohol dehydrogenase family)